MVWYYTGVQKQDTAEEPRALGRWLGISHRVRSDMCYWILTGSGKVIASTNVQHVTRLDQEDPSIAKQIEEFETKLNERLDDKNFRIDETKGVFYLDDESGDEDENAHARKMLMPEDKEYGHLTGTPAIDVDKIADEKGQEVIDKYIGAQLQIKLAGEEKVGTVVGRAADNT